MVRYFKDANNNPIMSQEKIDESWTEITKSDLQALSEAVTANVIETAEFRKAELKAKLAATDYKVLADYDGECTQALLDQRSAWRTELRTLEGE